MEKPRSSKLLSNLNRNSRCKVLVVGNLNCSREALKAALGKGKFALVFAPSVVKCTLKLRNFRPDAILISDTLLSENQDLTSLYDALRSLLIPIFIIGEKAPSDFSIQEVGDAETILVKQLNAYHSIARRVKSAFSENHN